MTPNVLLRFDIDKFNTLEDVKAYLKTIDSALNISINSNHPNLDGLIGLLVDPEIVPYFPIKIRYYADDIKTVTFDYRINKCYKGIVTLLDAVKYCLVHSSEINIMMPDKRQIAEMKSIQEINIFLSSRYAYLVANVDEIVN